MKNWCCTVDWTLYRRISNEMDNKVDDIIAHFENCDINEPDEQLDRELGPVVQSIVSLTTSLRGNFVKYIPTTLSNTLLFFESPYLGDFLNLLT